ncbi:MAG: glycosyltransferase [Chloroflexi bacterium]|nr:glycosyltransferase [Chloroflexota bacterium]
MIEDGITLHIMHEFVDGPWGGGNQFLKALREHLRKICVYSEAPEDARVILFNSYPFGNERLFELTIDLKVKQDTIVVHRLDGPVSRIRGRDGAIDKTIFEFNRLFVDGTVFQSGWSRLKNYEDGMSRSPFETTIINAPDTRIFNRDGSREFKGKVRLIASSWSSNARKGFELYRYLDERLDFNRYEMTFVGNSPVAFRNIKRLKPVPSHELAGILKEHDIYITASESDPCSNSLIEALHCGLPAVARNDGGHPEITGQAGELFSSDGEAIAAIDKVAGDYARYQSLIDLPSLEMVGNAYLAFARNIAAACSRGEYHPKTLSPDESRAFQNMIRRTSRLSALRQQLGRAWPFRTRGKEKSAS